MQQKAGIHFKGVRHSFGIYQVLPDSLIPAFQGRVLHIPKTVSPHKVYKK